MKAKQCQAIVQRVQRRIAWDARKEASLEIQDKEMSRGQEECLESVDKNSREGITSTFSSSFLV